METTRDLAELVAQVAGTAADATRRPVIAVTTVTDADAVSSIASSGLNRPSESDGDLPVSAAAYWYVPASPVGRCPAVARNRRTRQRAIMTPWQAS